MASFEISYFELKKNYYFLSLMNHLFFYPKNFLFYYSVKNNFSTINSCFLFLVVEKFVNDLILQNKNLHKNKKIKIFNFSKCKNYFLSIKKKYGKCGIYNKSLKNKENKLDKINFIFNCNFIFEINTLKIDNLSFIFQIQFYFFQTYCTIRCLTNSKILFYFIELKIFFINEKKKFYNNIVHSNHESFGITISEIHKSRILFFLNFLNLNENIFCVFNNNSNKLNYDIAIRQNNYISRINFYFIKINSCFSLGYMKIFANGISKKFLMRLFKKISSKILIYFWNEQQNSFVFNYYIQTFISNGSLGITCNCLSLSDNTITNLSSQSDVTCNCLSLSDNTITNLSSQSDVTCNCLSLSDNTIPNLSKQSDVTCNCLSLSANTTANQQDLLIQHTNTPSPADLHHSSDMCISTGQSDVTCNCLSLSANIVFTTKS